MNMAYIYEFPFITLSLLLFTLGIAEFHYQGSVVQKLRQAGPEIMGWSAWTHPESLPDRILRTRPFHLNTMVEKLNVACASIALVCALLCLYRSIQAAKTRANRNTADCKTLAHPGLVVLDRAVQMTKQERKERHVRWWTLCCATVTGICAVYALTCIIYTFTKLYGSSTWHYTDELSSSQHFTRESWACQMAVQYPDGVVDWAHMCRDGRTGRWLLVPMFVSFTMLTALSFVCWRNREGNDDEAELEGCKEGGVAVQHA
ncbi:uncharacterized protein LTR77_002334 [Saxophila tyrrhenica]|uniref:Uncharacterized protein n=1 Tax=Saxophila tyrrhenica TaxID=1690608 RepID=A0AAV9PLR3_9PEZI|nr:hypothetical protein LTR77_002334 [Saxophila tyrrhenica]